MIKAIWNDVVIAQSEHTIVIEGNHYFPKADVNTDYLVDSATTSVCPWKGNAKYYSVVVGTETNKDAAWYYPQPKEAAKEIKDYVAFWKGVSVKAE
ncbi:MAG: DUF427 domain-containing protein [Erysipelotrichaceae bacterium]